MNYITPEEFRALAKQIAGYIILTHAFIHVVGKVDSGPGQIILQARVALQNQMSHAAFMLALNLDGYYWKMQVHNGF